MEAQRARVCVCVCMRVCVCVCVQQRKSRWLSQGSCRAQGGRAIAEKGAERAHKPLLRTRGVERVRQPVRGLRWPIRAPHCTAAACAGNADRLPPGLP